MRIITVIIVVVFSSLCMYGCTNAEIASWSSLGSAGHITCYSGGKEIYDGESTGRIATVTNSDGWEFQEASTNKFVRVSGDCVIKN